ncbi:hypothetical protein CJD44_23505 [Streptomyces sp. alain-838]|nr:hypothetical protein CJD44_23505 [Streptomyces sp. alain-838]
MVRPNEVLAQDEVRLLQRALGEWGGPARCSDELAFGMGFVDARDLLDQCRILSRALGDDDPIKPVDWARTLLAAEIVFVSDLVGSGVEWQTTTGLTDEATLPILRAIQGKLARTVSAYYGKRPDA